MVSADRSTVEFPEARSDDADGLGVQLALLRQRFAELERVDVELTAALARVAEARALASLEIASAIAKIERKIAGREERTRQFMRDVAVEVDSTRARSDVLTRIAAGLEGLAPRGQGAVAPLAHRDREQTAVRHTESTPQSPIFRPPASDSPVNGKQQMVISGVSSVDAALALQRFAGALPGVERAAASGFRAGRLQIELQPPTALSVIDIARASHGALMPDGQADTGLCFVVADSNLF
jgi:hypothetical protein